MNCGTFIKIDPMNFNSNESHLLSESDPPPFVFTEGKFSKVLLVCDHAGVQIPLSLQHNTPTQEEMQTHAAYDIGAKNIAEVVANLIHAPLIAANYSRLVVDPNRRRSSPQLSPPVSDGIFVPFNQNLTDEQLDERWDNIHQPYHRRIREMLDTRKNQLTAFVAIHSFTPQLSDGIKRPWHIDLLSRKPSKHFGFVKQSLQKHFPDLNIGESQVFQVTDRTDYTIPIHAEPRNLPHFSIEVRNDMIRTKSNVERYAQAIADTITQWTEREFA